jgi:hypothetical protein
MHKLTVIKGTANKFLWSPCNGSSEFKETAEDTALTAQVATNLERILATYLRIGNSVV